MERPNWRSTTENYHWWDCQQSFSSNTAIFQRKSFKKYCELKIWRYSTKCWGFIYQHWMGQERSNNPRLWKTEDWINKIHVKGDCICLGAKRASVSHFVNHEQKRLFLCRKLWGNKFRQRESHQIILSFIEEEYRRNKVKTSCIFRVNKRAISRA